MNRPAEEEEEEEEHPLFILLLKTLLVPLLLRTVWPFSSAQLLLKADQETHPLIQLPNKRICRLSTKIEASWSNGIPDRLAVFPGSLCIHLL